LVADEPQIAGSQLRRSGDIVHGMDLDAALIEDLRREHGVHTLILYGSRARGDATTESDIDVAGFAEVTETVRDARLWNGMFLDAFVYPTALARTPDADMLKLCGGRVLLDERQLAVPLLEHLATLDRQGLPSPPKGDLQMRRVWARKMLARVRRGDVEAHYRRHWLLYQLLEDYFALRGERYRGPKLALAALQLRAPATFAAFERALAPEGSLNALEALVDHVVG
jgi:hypothetical protein